ncbi:hypothetical protein [Streptomyces prunicolor]
MACDPHRPRRPRHLHHTSENKAYTFVHASLGDDSPADKAEVRHWEDGRWILHDRLTADELH